MPERPLPAFARGLPWPARAVVGVAAVGLGLYLVGRPLDSLTTLALYVAASCVVIGVGALARPERDLASLLIGAGWTVLGLVVLVLPGHAIEALPVVLAVVLLCSGVLRLFSARRGTVDERLANVLLGLAECVLGVVALAWTDVTLVVVAALFGISAVVFGLSLLVEAVLRRDRGHAAAEPGLIRRWGRVLGSSAALIASVAVLLVSSGIEDASPRVDDFYTAPDRVPDEPGVLLRSEAFDREIPDGATGTRILYTTTDALGKPALASGILVLPEAPRSQPRSVVAWAHGTTGYARQCAPSLLKEPFTAGAFPDVMDLVVEQGWAVVATDYAGLGTEGPQPYLIGRGEARSVLDAVRAARSLEGAGLSEDHTVLWGHSQGGGAALWANQEQPTYAPDVPLAGTVAMAPAIDTLALAKSLPDITGGTVFGSFVYNAYADTYPDLALKDFIKPAAIPLVKKIGSRCLSEPGVLASVLTALSLRDTEVLKVDPSKGALGVLLRDNIARSPGPGSLLIAQGETDGLVLPRVTKAYVAQLRADGHQVEFRTFPGLGHMELVQRGSALLPELIAWTAARLDR